MTGSTPLLLIENKLETLTFCFCSTSLYFCCSNRWWGFLQPSTSQSLPQQFSFDERLTNIWSTVLVLSLFVFFSSHFHSGSLPSFSTHSCWVFELSFAGFLADVVNADPLVFSLLLDPARLAFGFKEKTKSSCSSALLLSYQFYTTNPGWCRVICLT